MSVIMKSILFVKKANEAKAILKKTGLPKKKKSQINFSKH